MSFQEIDEKLQSRFEWTYIVAWNHDRLTTRSNGQIRKTMQYVLIRTIFLGEKHSIAPWLLFVFRKF